MTIEQLYDLPAEGLESLTDAQLLEFFKPFFAVTRPELAIKPQATKQQIPISPQQKKAYELLAANGVDLAFIKHKKK